MKNTPFMMVIWKDALSPDDDEPHEYNHFDKEGHRDLIYISVGIVLRDDEEGVVLCRDYRIREQLSENEIAITKEMIITKKYLK